jgi:hypothetical protein
MSNHNRLNCGFTSFFARFGFGIHFFIIEYCGNLRNHQYYSNTADSTYGGANRFRKDDGEYDPALEDRPIASVGKMAAAVRLGAMGDDANRRLYCNKAVASIQNAGGGTGVKDCNQPGAMLTPRQTFGKSVNLACVQGLRRESNEDLLALTRQFGLTPAQAQAMDPAMGLCLGMATASPRALHRMAHAILLGVAGRPALANSPSILSRVQVVRDDGTWEWETPPRPEGSQIDLRKLFAVPNTIPFVRDVLSAPLDPAEDGTIRALNDWSAAKRKGVDLHIAKTGTGINASKTTRDRYLVGGLQCGKELFSYFILVGAADPSRPLGEGIGGDDLATLARIALKDLGC